MNGHNKCPECAGIEHTLDGQDTKSLCKNCIESLKSKNAELQVKLSTTQKTLEKLLRLDIKKR